MKKLFYKIALLALAALLAGCSMQTVDQLYRIPKRSEQYSDLQAAMDQAMAGRVFCAPRSGENQQTVQQADLDGDGLDEYLIFASSGAEKPLHILIFCQQGGEYVHLETIESAGTAFDQVEYVQMDARPGLEMVVGRLVSDQVLRSVSVYSFAEGRAEQLLSANYSKFLTCDLDEDSYAELMLLAPGTMETDNGVAVLYGMENGSMERSREADMSEPAERLKRILVGKLHGGVPAVYVASSANENAIVTDVYALIGGEFTNVSFSNESGTSVHTLRNYYVYADDIDNDGTVELPDLMSMMPVTEQGQVEGHDLIRWYAMAADGAEVDKLFTFHNFLGGWYLTLDEAWASRISVVQSGGSYDFYLWTEGAATKIFTVYVLTGTDREEQAAMDNRFVLHRGESTVYAAYMEVASGTISVSREDLINGFGLIRQDWKTGET